MTTKNLKGISFGYSTAIGNVYRLQEPTKGISEIKASCYDAHVAGMGPNMILPRGKDNYNKMLVGGFDFEGCKEKDICISDMLRFFQSAQEYSKLGVPHKRGIILYGPPGTGKSAIALAMEVQAVESGFTVFRINSEESNDVLCQLPKEVMKLVIIEEIERFNGDLSLCVDDLSPGTFVVGTTNEPSSMHDRVTRRPGRFDRLLKIDRMTPGMLRNMATKYNMLAHIERLKEYPVLTPAQMAEMSLRINIYGYSPEDGIKSVIEEFYR